MQPATLLNDIYFSAKTYALATKVIENETNSLMRVLELCLTQKTLDEVYRFQRDLEAIQPDFEYAADVIGEDFGEMYEGGDRSSLYASIVLRYFFTGVTSFGLEINDLAINKIKSAVKILLEDASEEFVADLIETLLSEKWFVAASCRPETGVFTKMLNVGLLAKVEKTGIRFDTAGISIFVLKDNINIVERYGDFFHHLGGTQIQITLSEAFWLSQHIPKNCCKLNF